MSRTSAEIQRDMRQREQARREEERRAAQSQFEAVRERARQLQRSIAAHQASFREGHFTQFKPNLAPPRETSQLIDRARSLAQEIQAAEAELERNTASARSRALTSSLPALSVPEPAISGPTIDESTVDQAQRSKVEHLLIRLASTEMDQSLSSSVADIVGGLAEDRRSYDDAIGALRSVLRTAENRRRRDDDMRRVRRSNAAKLSNAEAELAGLEEDAEVAHALSELRRLASQPVDLPREHVATERLASMKAAAIERVLKKQDADAAAEALAEVMTEKGFLLTETFLDDLRAEGGAVIGFVDSNSGGCWIQMSADGSIEYDAVVANDAPAKAGEGAQTCERMASLEAPLRDRGLRYAVQATYPASGELMRIERERIPTATKPAQRTATRTKAKEIQQ